MSQSWTFLIYMNIHSYYYESLDYGSLN